MVLIHIHRLHVDYYVQGNRDHSLWTQTWNRDCGCKITYTYLKNLSHKDNLLPLIL